ncbi:MAG: hypothetical protein ACW7DN_14695, partial [Paraglaciecola chathamensis]
MNIFAHAAPLYFGDPDMSPAITNKSCSFNIKKTGLASAFTLSVLFTAHTAFADVTVDTKYGAV